MKKPVAETFKNRFREYLKSKGLACTSQRDAILEYLLNDSSHFNAETLIRALQKRRMAVSRATVYRTLSHLEEAGFIREVALNADHTHYEFIGETAHHEHLVCEICGSIIEFSDQELENRIEAIASDQNFVITRHTVQISGICGRCNEK